jgi:hypothetical protein
MNRKQFNKWLGIQEEVKGKGNPFTTFKNKQEANDYLVSRGIISRQELFLRENPELRSKVNISEEVASTPL